MKLSVSSEAFRDAKKTGWLLPFAALLHHLGVLRFEIESINRIAPESDVSPGSVIFTFRNIWRTMSLDVLVV